MEMVRLREDPFVSLVRILQPAEYDEFVLRYSPAAQQLRGEEHARHGIVARINFAACSISVGAIMGQPVYYYAGDNTAVAHHQQQKQLQAQSRKALIKTALGGTVCAGAYQLRIRFPFIAPRVRRSRNWASRRRFISPPLRNQPRH